MKKGKMTPGVKSMEKVNFSQIHTLNTSFCSLSDCFSSCEFSDDPDLDLGGRFWSPNDSTDFSSCESENDHETNHKRNP